ncbi:GNAT family N-acetyltransferase [Aurantibacter sp.]|uniref:GNAT family N-acetyltransferase n=1 Tax=Aurantibacter sp. TaxID=2807103 RepID=UPI0032646BEC
MTIRKLLPTDNESLAKIIKAIFVEFNAPKIGTVYSDPTTNDLYKLFEHEKSILWVIEADKEVLGCCGIYPTKGLPEGCAELVKFYFSPKARGNGWGKELLEYNIKSAIDYGYSQLYLECLPHFSSAINLYESLAFKHIDKALGDSGHTSCNIWMVKNLLT